MSWFQVVFENIAQNCQETFLQHTVANHLQHAVANQMHHKMPGLCYKFCWRLDSHEESTAIRVRIMYLTELLRVWHARCRFSDAKIAQIKGPFGFRIQVTFSKKFIYKNSEYMQSNSSLKGNSQIRKGWICWCQNVSLSLISDHWLTFRQFQKKKSS